MGGVPARLFVQNGFYCTGFMRRCLFSFPARPVCIRLLWLILLVRPHRDVYLSPRAKGGGGVRCCRSQRQPQQQTTKQSTEVLKASPVQRRGLVVNEVLDTFARLGVIVVQSFRCFHHVDQDSSDLRFVFNCSVQLTHLGAYSIAVLCD